MTKEVMKQALEALELAQDNLRDHGDNCFLHDEGEYNRCFCGKDSLSDHLQSVVEYLEEALKQEQDEPVAYFDPQKGGFYWAKPTTVTSLVTVDVEPLPLYTTPQQGCAECGVGGGYALYCLACAEKYVKPEWVGLSDEDDLDWEKGDSLIDLFKAIEAKLKEKNAL
jgi:hypothetical protein